MAESERSFVGGEKPIFIRWRAKKLDKKLKAGFREGVTSGGWARKEGGPAI